jgi:hypothetical protein
VQRAGGEGRRSVSVHDWAKQNEVEDEAVVKEARMNRERSKRRVRGREERGEEGSNVLGRSRLEGPWVRAVQHLEAQEDWGSVLRREGEGLSGMHCPYPRRQI